jgi:hypothetical protein
MYSLSTPPVPGWRIGGYYDRTFRDDYEYTGSGDLMVSMGTMSPIHILGSWAVLAEVQMIRFRRGLNASADYFYQLIDSDFIRIFVKYLYCFRLILRVKKKLLLY